MYATSSTFESTALLGYSPYIRLERLGTHVASSATVCQIPNPVRCEFASLGPIPTFAALCKRSFKFAIGSYDCLPDPCPGSRPEYAAAAEKMGAELVRRGIGLVLARA